MLEPIGIEVLTLKDIPSCVDLDPEETEITFSGNAMLKAKAAALRSGLPAVADDSGLEVDALDGAPGVYSARYAGGRGDEANNLKLIEALAGVPQQRRTARFRCALALFVPTEYDAKDTFREAVAKRSDEADEVVNDSDGDGLIWHGSIEGLIVDQPRGKGGFGYDPHFLLPSKGLTTAELESAEKNRISHRGQAVRKLAKALSKPNSA